MNKPKILFVGEFTQLATGYATYGMEVLKRLHASGKYEVAELACYVSPEDPRLKQIPWKVFTNHPGKNNKEALELYKSNQINEFGAFAFEQTCIEFRPDIVFDIRDFWMMSFEEESPFRRLYKWVIMPTVDATPQHEQWLSTYMNADAVFSYSDWGAQILRNEGGSLINVQGSASPGADTQTFLPMNKTELRSKFGFEDGVQIIGTVMRNQGRKLYPELIDAFVEFQTKAPADMAKKTYLYLHTSYPDQGWDIPRLIKRSGMSHKILVTYKCRSCNAVFPSFFMDVVGPCIHCGKPTASMPNTQEGVDRSTLAQLINLFDCYVQYANSEGFGMPMVEAASCGVTVFATDYSAMSDVVRKVNGYPIAVERYRVDSDFGCDRAVPSNTDLVNKLIKFFSHVAAERERKSKQARQGVEKNYTWDMTAKKWMTVFDSLISGSSHAKPTKNDSNVIGCIQLQKNNGYQNQWDSSPTIHKPITTLPTPGINTNEEFVRWAILNVLGQPERLNSYLSLRLIRDLNWGSSMKNLVGNYVSENSFLATIGNLKPFGVQDAVAELIAICNNHNYWEERRWKAAQDLTKSEKI